MSIPLDFLVPCGLFAALVVFALQAEGHVARARRWINERSGVLGCRLGDVLIGITMRLPFRTPAQRARCRDRYALRSLGVVRRPRTNFRCRPEPSWRSTLPGGRGYVP